MTTPHSDRYELPLLPNHKPYPTFQQMKDRLIYNRLRICGWNRTITARSLLVDRNWLSRQIVRMQTMGVEVPNGQKGMPQYLIDRFAKARQIKKEIKHGNRRV